MLADSLLLVVGCGAVTVVHTAREAVLEGQAGKWIEVLDWALIVGECTLFVTLVGVPAWALAVELLVAVGVGIYRIRHAFRTGTRLPPPDDPDEADDDR